MKIIKVRKKFDFEGLELRIVYREESYMNSKETVTMTRVLAPNGGMIPLHLKHKQTLKSIQEDCINLLRDFEKRGSNIIEEMTKEINL